jgi:hypothetical protein
VTCGFMVGVTGFEPATSSSRITCQHPGHHAKPQARSDVYVHGGAPTRRLTHGGCCTSLLYAPGQAAHDPEPWPGGGFAPVPPLTYATPLQCEGCVGSPAYAARGQDLPWHQRGRSRTPGDTPKRITECPSRLEMHLSPQARMYVHWCAN